MDTAETVHLLRRAHDEIIELRRQIGNLESRAHAYDTLAIIARLAAPQESRGYGLDVAWEIAKALKALEATPEPTEAA